jgi:hypothetical protein
MNTILYFIEYWCYYSQRLTTLQFFDGVAQRGQQQE